MKEVIIYKVDGEVTNVQAVGNLLNSLPDDGRFLLTAKNINRRSLDQNAYYWKIVVPLVKEGLYDAGFSEVKTNELAHDIMKIKFLNKQVVNEKTGEIIEVPGSTAELTTLEFSNFLEEVWQWSAEYLSLNIPSPSQQSKLFAV